MISLQVWNSRFEFGNFLVIVIRIFEHAATRRPARFIIQLLTPRMDVEIGKIIFALLGPE